MNFIKNDFEKIINILFESKEFNFSLNNQKVNQNIKNIINSVPQNKQKILFSKLDNLLDEYLSYTRKTNKEYYKAGFIDALNLIIPALFS